MTYRKGWTKGPWKRRKEWNADNFALEVYPSSFKFDVGEAAGIARVGDVYDECVANARLIAQAPRLFEQHESDLIDLRLLREAIMAGDPTKELLVRITDMERRKHAALAAADG